MGWWYIKEQWKQINGFEYHYVSNFGNIKSTRRWSGTKFYNREHLSNFIANNEEAIYLKYCEIYPEKITSDFMIEDVDEIDLEYFINTYMIQELEEEMNNERKVISAEEYVCK